MCLLGDRREEHVDLWPPREGMVVLLHHVYADDPDTAGTLSPCQRRGPGGADRNGVGQRRPILGHAAKLRLDGLRVSLGMPDVPPHHLRDAMDCRTEATAPELLDHSLATFAAWILDVFPRRRDAPDAVWASIHDVLEAACVWMQCPDRAVHQHEIVGRIDAACIVAPPHPDTL